MDCAGTGVSGWRAWFWVALIVGSAGHICFSQHPAEGSGWVEPLVRGPVDNADRVTLAGTVDPLIRGFGRPLSADPEAELVRDLGPVDDSFAVDRLYLILGRSAAQERALGAYLEVAHTPGASGYHHWLTPAEFGHRFGAADSDIAAVRGWLEAQGFRVQPVHPGRIVMEFSGSAAQIRTAFRTDIHHYRFRGAGAEVEHFANNRDPKIPAAFAGLIKGISPMHDFHPRPLLRVAGRTSYEVKSHVAKALWSYPTGNNSQVYEMTPGDFAVQYGLGPVYAAGTTGIGQTIGIVSLSNLDLSLVQQYQALFGLPSNLPSVVIDGNDPGQNEDATEAYLDVEMAGAVAPGAKVVLYTSAGSVLSDPLLSSALRALEDNQVSVLSVSYGECEAALGPAGNAAWASLWQEAAAQGITGFVAAGDGGSAGCDDFNSKSFADGGLAVNGLGSTPWNVSVGGTDLYFSSYAAGGSVLSAQVGSYWNQATTGTPAVSLLKRVPEQAWNDGFGLNASNGGVYNLTSSSIVAGGGGGSNYAIQTATGGWAGYAKPGWQSGPGVPGDRVRDLPDVSLFAANGANFSFYPICAAPGDCAAAQNSATVYVTSVGGTSASAPAMAAIQALVNQATGSRQGQANYVYYALAAKNLAQKPFVDVTAGTNAVPCDAGTWNCVLASVGPVKGFYTETGFAAGPGFDRATGLGSVNVANLISGWHFVTFKPTTTTLNLSPAVFAHGTTASVTATVAPKSGSGVPTGNLVLNSSAGQAYANGLAVFTLTGAAVNANLSNLPGGTYQVQANYSGDNLWSSSYSAPVTVTVTQEKATLNTSGWVLNPTDNVLYPLQGGMYIPYGSEVFVDAQPMGVSHSLSGGSTTPATGVVAYTDFLNSAASGRTAVVPISGAGIAEWSPGTLSVGTHIVKAAYAGDASYASASAPAAAKLTVFPGTTTLSVIPLQVSVAAGGTVTVDVEMYSGYLPLVGTSPTGSVSVTLGGQTVTSPLKSWSLGSTNQPVQETVVTFTNVPPGILPLMAAYRGDGNWNGSSTFYGTVTSLSPLPAPVVSLTASAASFTAGQTVTLTGNVSGTAAKSRPVGAVTISWENGNRSYQAALTAAVAPGSSAFALNLPANSLASGSNLFVATFNGDSNYSAQSSLPTTVILTAGDFSLITTTQALAVPVGGTGTASVALSASNGFAVAVTVSCQSAVGITCAPVVSSPTISSGGISDNITLKVASTVKPGRYPAMVTAAGGGRIHSVQFLVIVQ